MSAYDRLPAIPGHEASGTIAARSGRESLGAGVPRQGVEFETVGAGESLRTIIEPWNGDDAVEARTNGEVA